MKDARVDALFSDSGARVRERAERFDFDELLEFANIAFPPALRAAAVQDLRDGRLRHYAHDERAWGGRTVGVDTFLEHLPLVALDTLTLAQAARWVSVSTRHRPAVTVSRMYAVASDLAKTVGWDNLLEFAEHVDIGSPVGQRLIYTLHAKGVPASYLANAGQNMSYWNSPDDIYLAYKAQLPSEYLYDLPESSRETSWLGGARFLVEHPDIDDYLRAILDGDLYQAHIHHGACRSSTLVKVALWRRGVSAAQARQMEPWRLDDTIRLAETGVSPEYARALYGQPLSEVISLWNSGVPAEYAAATRSA